MCNFINKDNFKVSNFYRFPKALMSKRYDSLSLESKVAYSFLLDRVSLSIENDWVNEEGDVFVKIKRKELMKRLGIKGTQKMVKTMDELKSFGLIVEEKLGFGRCNKIFLCNLENMEKENMNLNDKINEELEKEIIPCDENIYKAQDELCCGLKSFENRNSEDKNSNHDTFESQNTGFRKSNFEGFVFQKHNKTNINKTKNIKTNMIRTQSNQNSIKTFDFKTLENNNPQLKTFEIQNSVDKVNNFVDEKADLNHKNLEKDSLNHEESKRIGLSHKESSSISLGSKEDSTKISKNKKYDYDVETLDTARELLGWTVDYKDANTLLKEACGNLYVLDLAYERMLGVKSKIKNIVGYLKTTIQRL